MPKPLSDEEFHQQALAGGASRSVRSGAVPDRGVMVGGVRNADDLPYPEVKRPVDQFSLDDVRQHARAIRDHFGRGEDVYQGAWVEDKNVVLDASDKFEDRVGALTAAKSRGERAVYDVKGQRDIHVDEAKKKVRN